MKNLQPTELLTPVEAAEAMRTTVKALSVFRCRGTGPQFVKAGRKVLYRRADLDAYIAKGLRESTRVAP